MLTDEVKGTELPMAEEISILIAHPDAGVSETLVQAIRELKYHVQAEVNSQQALLDECRRQRPNLIISSVDMRDGSAIDALIKISDENPIPAIVVTDNDSLKEVEHALEDHVMAYLLLPIDKDQIQPTIYLVLKRFEQFEALHEEVQDLRQTLADRKIIERAKGVLMSQEQCDEEDAFRKLQRTASDRRTKLVNIANEILATHEASDEDDSQ